MQTRNYMAAIAGSALMLLSTTSSAWTIQENYDGQSTGSLCAPMWGDGSDTTVSNEQSVSGNNSCRMAITSGGLKWGGGFNFTSALHKGDSVWVRFRLYVPAGFNYTVDPGSGGHLKFIRMSIRDGGGTVGRLDWLWSRPNALPSYITGLDGTNAQPIACMTSVMQLPNQLWGRGKLMRCMRSLTTRRQMPVVWEGSCSGRMES